MFGDIKYTNSQHISGFVNT